MLRKASSTLAAGRPWTIRPKRCDASSAARHVLRLPTATPSRAAEVRWLNRAGFVLQFRRARTPFARAPPDRDRCDRCEYLHRLAVDFGESCAQSFVATDDLRQRLLERANIEFALEPQGA